LRCRSCHVTWDLVADGFFLLFDHGIYDPFVESSRCNGLDNAKLLPLLTKRALAKLRGDQIAKGCVRDPTRSACADQEMGWIWSSHLITSSPDLRSDIDALGWVLRAWCCKSIRLVLM